MSGVRLLVGALALLVLPACKQPPTAPRVNRLVRETWAATRLEAPRRELAPRVVAGRPDALGWKASTGVLRVAPDGSVQLGPGTSAEAAVNLNPAVAYSLRASATGALALDVRKTVAGQASTWEVVSGQRSPAGLEFELDLSYASELVELRLRASGPTALVRFEVSERPLRSRLQVVNARDAALRGFVRRRTGGLEHVLDSLLATGHSAYEWPLAPAPYPRIFTVEIAGVERHGEDRNPPASVAMVVEFRADGRWFEAARRLRGGKGDPGGWLALRTEVRHADAVRLRTEPTAPGPSATVAWGMPTVRPAERGSAPDVFIFTLDALRNDQLGTYGGPPDLTPILDRLAKDSVVFDEARTARGNTWEGLAGIAFATFPETVGVARRGDLPVRGARGIADEFAEAGYMTARLGWALMPPGMFGLMDTEDDAELGTVGDQAVTEQVRTLLSRRQDAPLFVWVHFAATHYTYLPEPGFLPPDVPPDIVTASTFDRVVKDRGPPEALAAYRTMYQACVRQTDAHMGDLLSQLRRPDRAGGPPIVAVLADHGSHHGERGLWFVHATLDRAVLRVPFMLHAPGRIMPGRVAVLTRTIDLGPTLLDYAGLPAGNFFGQSMRGLIEGQPEPGRVNIVRKVLYGVYAVEDDRYKLIVNPEQSQFYWPQFLGLSIDWPTVELHAWRQDPGETQNLAAREPLAVGELWRQLGSTRMTVDRPITPEIRRLLMQAGYLPRETAP
jgi:N-sulfoglucosamine sulfohydrolase